MDRTGRSVPRQARSTTASCRSPAARTATFTLWYLVKRQELKPLVVRFDHGFLRPTLQENTDAYVQEARRRLHALHAELAGRAQADARVAEAQGRLLLALPHRHLLVPDADRCRSLQRCRCVIWGEPSAEYTCYYGYDEDEEVDERRFNRFVNLGITAEDMDGMLDGTISLRSATSIRSLHLSAGGPELRSVRSVCLGSYIPWDVKKQVEIIKRELGWKGDQVEGVPPEYDYEKIECFMQGVRDYIKYIKRGFGRTTHLVSHRHPQRPHDARRGRAPGRTNSTASGPAALDLFLDYLGLSEEEFLKVIEPHVVSPHTMPSCEECMRNRSNWVPEGFRGSGCA